MGPYTYPSLSPSPNFREAPMLIPSPDGPWYQVSGNTRIQSWNKYELPLRVRHGCMIPITKAEYDALVAAFGPPAGTETPAAPKP